MQYFNKRNGILDLTWCCRLAYFPWGRLELISYWKQEAVFMLYIEKDDPREAPESGDKKPDPDKK